MVELARAIDEGDWPRALGLALAAWRAARSPALADLIDALSARCPRAPAPRRDQQEHWMRAALAYDPVEACALLDTVHHRSFKGDSPWPLVVERLGDSDPIITRLLATARTTVLPRATPRADELPTHQRNRIERLCALVRWPDDPRVATALAKWFVHDSFLWEEPHHHGPRIVLEVLAAQLVRLGDARVIPMIEDCIEHPRARTPALRETQHQLARQIVDGIAPPPPDDPRIVQAVSVLARPALPRSTVDERALWDAVAREPDALGPRMVLADYLMERSDARGELIALQCAGDSKSAARADQLLADHWNAWLGDLALVLKRGESTFERGTLATAVLGLESTPGWAFAAVADHRELATVTHWMYSKYLQIDDYVAILAPQPEPLLRVSLRAIDLGAFEAARPHWHIRAIDLELAAGYRAHDHNHCARIFAQLMRMFPAVEELRLRYWPRLDDLPHALPLLARLQHLRRIYVPVVWSMGGDNREALQLVVAAMPIVEIVG